MVKEIVMNSVLSIIQGTAEVLCMTHTGSLIPGGKDAMFDLKTHCNSISRFNLGRYETWSQSDLSHASVRRFRYGTVSTRVNLLFSFIIYSPLFSFHPGEHLKTSTTPLVSR